MDELSKLIELQQVDQELMRIEEMKGDLPEKVRDTKRTLNTLQSDLEKQTDRLDEVKKEQRKNEVVVQDDSEKIKEKQDKLYLVTTNKEYDSLTSEIEQFKAKVDESEMRLVELSDEEEQLKENISLQQQRVEELEKNLEKREADLERTVEKTQKEQAKLEDQRETIVKDISRQKISRYNRIRNARNGLAVVPVVRGACGGCHQRIPPQRVVEIRTGDRMITCEICGRILYWPESREQENAE